MPPVSSTSVSATSEPWPTNAFASVSADGAEAADVGVRSRRRCRPTCAPRRRSCCPRSGCRRSWSSSCSSRAPSCRRTTRRPGRPAPSRRRHSGRRSLLRADGQVAGRRDRRAALDGDRVRHRRLRARRRVADADRAAAGVPGHALGQRVPSVVTLTVAARDRGAGPTVALIVSVVVASELRRRDVDRAAAAARRARRDDPVGRARRAARAADALQPLRAAPGRDVEDRAGDPAPLPTPVMLTPSTRKTCLTPPAVSDQDRPAAEAPRQLEGAAVGADDVVAVAVVETADLEVRRVGERVRDPVQRSGSDRARSR